MPWAPKELELICSSVGQIIVPFAILEASINASIETLYKHLGGNALEKELPRGFGRRIAYLEKCSLKLPILAGVKDELQKILALAEAESTIRNNIAHGYVSNFDSKNGILTFKQLEAYTNRQSHTEQTNHYSVTEMLESGRKIGVAAAAMNSMAYRILDLSMP